MPQRITLKTIAPGQGRLLLPGAAARSGWRIAVQRNTDRHFLATGGRWQPGIAWHGLPTAQDAGTTAVGDTLVLDDELLEGIALCRRDNRFLVTAEAAERSYQAPLTIDGPLVLKEAGATPEPVAEATPAPEPEPEPETELLPESEPALEPELETELLPRSEPQPEPGPGPGPATGADDASVPRGQGGEPPTEVPPADPRMRLVFWIIAGVLVISIALALWVLLGGGTGGPDGPAPASALRGRALYNAVRAADPTPQGLLAEAERADRAGDCDAATLLYMDAATRPAVAVQVARRFDPRGFRPSDCFAAANAERAENAYRVAADAGQGAAQRRLGEILIEARASGPTHEQGLDYLRRAAEAGDRQAAELLRRHAR